MAGEPAARISSAALVVAQPAILLLRPWLHESTSPSWAGSQPWIAMLQDAIVCTGGATLPNDSSEGGVLVASFPKTSLAMAASRRLHALVAGYALESKGELSCVSLLIAPAESPDIASLAQHLHRKGQPAQTLLLVARGTVIPSSKKLEDSVPFGLEMHELPYPQQPQTSQDAKQLLSTHKERFSIAQPPLDVQPPVLPALDSAFSWLRQIIIQFPKSVAIGMAFTVLGGALTLSRLARQPLPPLTKIPPSIPAPQQLIEPNKKIQHGFSKENVEPLKKLPSAPAPVRIVEKSSHSRGDLTPEQIRQILNRGQSALDRGCYTEATGYYRRVLGDDPHNETAENGLNKVRIRMKLTEENALCSR